MKLLSKAQTLAAIENKLNYAIVLPQFRFKVEEWNQNKTISSFDNIPSWVAKQKVIVRSSAGKEDAENHSYAGHYLSIQNCKGVKNINEAIDDVIESFGSCSNEDEIFIQPMLKHVSISGVAFTKDPNTGSNYYVINYDDKNGSTSTVTDGSTNDAKTYYIRKTQKKTVNTWSNKLIDLLQELESMFNTDELDVEFALSKSGDLYLLQVRKLVMNNAPVIDSEKQEKCLNDIHCRIKQALQPHPYLFGDKNILGVMPDWNPAEIIGVRPKPLSISLYKDLITDSTWAYQRNNYGYRNLRSFPLLLSLHGFPYIDVRTSFNSFIPNSLDHEIAAKLVNYYIDKLSNNPANHDKVEFEIIYSCYTFDIQERLDNLDRYKFTKTEKKSIEVSLRDLTNNIINSKQGLWKKDIEKLNVLQGRQKIINQSNLSILEKIYWLKEDCKRYGTLPFAGLARAAFIAVQLLNSLKAISILSDEDCNDFMLSLESVSSRMDADFCEMTKQEFLNKYGHLRPGTYDILSPRYDEQPDLYFDWDKKRKSAKADKTFSLNLSKLNNLDKLLQKHDIHHDVLSLFNFIKAAIEGREYAKFIFTKSLSDILSYLNELGEQYAISRNDMSYLDIQILHDVYSTSGSLKCEIEESISNGKSRYIINEGILLPPLIKTPDDIWGFELPVDDPNYITMLKSTAEIVILDKKNMDIENKIVFITSADPGYDWIFSKNISGFITMYGGVNSHMAIRAGEQGVPAIIGAGPTLYNRWSSASLLEIDCANRKVSIIK